MRGWEEVIWNRTKMHTSKYKLNHITKIIFNRNAVWIMFCILFVELPVMTHNYAYFLYQEWLLNWWVQDLAQKHYLNIRIHNFFGLESNYSTKLTILMHSYGIPDFLGQSCISISIKIPHQNLTFLNWAWSLCIHGRSSNWILNIKPASAIYNLALLSPNFSILRCLVSPWKKFPSPFNPILSHPATTFIHGFSSGP